MILSVVTGDPRLVNSAVYLRSFLLKEHTAEQVLFNITQLQLGQCIIVLFHFTLLQTNCWQQTWPSVFAPKGCQIRESKKKKSLICYLSSLSIKGYSLWYLTFYRYTLLKIFSLVQLLGLPVQALTVAPLALPPLHRLELVQVNPWI